jgi:hypothetical protein
MVAQLNIVSTTAARSTVAAAESEGLNMTVEVEETSQTPDQLREAYDRQKARSETAEGKLEDITFKALGLDPSKGIGKAFKMTYEGDIEPDELGPIQEALKSEFDYVPKSADPPPPPPPDPKSVNPEISQAEKEAADLINQSAPAPIDPKADAVAKMSEEGDWAGVFEVGLQTQGIKIGTDL